MQYRKLVKNGDDLSVLGFGCMRFHLNGNSKSSGVNVELAHRQLMHAYEKGVNYFDTAYMYHGGKSESILGSFIKKNNLRDKVYIADKLPAFLMTKNDHIEKIFNTQLKRLETDYIDYYLMHMLDSLHTWNKLKEKGILEFIKEKKQEGKIRYIGFSFHGTADEFINILEDYEWDFCQIQYNYLDEYNQAGLNGLKKAYEKGIGVVVMEPLRGGGLASMAPTKVKATFDNFEIKHSPAYWGFRWVLNHKEVSVVLSGMNEFEHIDENAKVSSSTLPDSMPEKELNMIDEVKKIYTELTKVPCTGCGYCMPCPFNVDIPSTFSDYNSKYFFDSRISKFQYLSRSTGFHTGIKTGGNLCTACGKCKKNCPQSIDIPKMLKEAHSSLSNPVMSFGISIGGKILRMLKK